MNRQLLRLLRVFSVIGTVFYLTGCSSPQTDTQLTNFSHLDRLLLPVQLDETDAAVVRATAPPPDYQPAAYPDGRLASVQDAARAAIAYLWKAEASGDADAVDTAEGLLRFVVHMQSADGRFVNWLDEGLEPIPQTLDTTILGRTTARAVWAIGEGIRILGVTRYDTRERLWRALRNTYPALDAQIENSTPKSDGWPKWLPDAGAAAELLLGLVAARSADDTHLLTPTIEALAEGLLRTQAGDSTDFPYSAFLSTPGVWEGAGNAQADALCWAGTALHRLDWFNAGFFETRDFYRYLLVHGPFDRLDLSRGPEGTERSGVRAEVVRPAVHALLIVYGLTREQRFAAYAGEFAAWLLRSGPGMPVYDPSSGRGFDSDTGEGGNGPAATADATVESLLTLLPAEMDPAVREAMQAGTF